MLEGRSIEDKKEEEEACVCPGVWQKIGEKFEERSLS
jgi:hypothetical protein